MIHGILEPCNFSYIYVIENISFPVEKISKIPLIRDWTITG